MTMPGGSNDRQVNVTLNGNVDPFVRSMTAANQATLKLGDSLKKIDDYMVRLTKRAGIGAMAVGGAGLVSTFGDVKQAAALQQSFSALAAQATQTGTNVGSVSTAVQRLSTQIPVATQSLAAMATQISALGVTGTANIIRLTKQAEQLSAATNTAPGQLFTQLIQMNQSLGGSLQNLERYGSALTSIQQNMGISAQATLEMSNSIQAVGQKAGISETNLLGLSAAFVKVGADGNTGAQAFNQVMNAMTDSVARNSDTMKTFANILGITTSQFAKLVQGNPTQAFVQFIDAITAQGQKASITLQALGLDSVRLQRVFAQLTSGQANLGGALAQANSAFQENTATATAAAAAWDTLNGRITELKNGAGQIKEQLGAPLLAVIQPLTAGLTGLEKGISSLIHLTNDAPWPIGDTLTALVTKAPALLILGGAFVTLTAAVSKFAGVWRVLSGMVGVNAFRGFMDARRGGGPRDVQEELGGVGGRVGSFLYRTSYGLGRGGSDIGVNNRRGFGALVAGYPFMRARQQFMQSYDTFRHPLDPEARDQRYTDPLSMYGIAQAAQGRGRDMRRDVVGRLRRPGSSDFQNNIADSLERGFGEFDQSPEGIRRRRFNYVESVRTKATDSQKTLNASLGRTDLADLVSSAEAAQYYQRMGTLDGYTPTDFHSMGLGRLRRAGQRQARFVGDHAAERAGTAFDASLTEDETAKMANPFQKLANKVKEITSDLTKSTATATKSVFTTIETFFSQAMAKIVQMAQAAKAQIAQVQGLANPGMVNPLAPGYAAGIPLGPNRMGGLPPVPPRLDASAAREAARISAEETAKVARGLPSIADLAAESVIGFPAGTRIGGVGPRRGVSARDVGAAGDMAQGVPEGMEEGGTARGGFRAGSIRSQIANSRFGQFVSQTAIPKMGDLASSAMQGLGQLGSAFKTTAGLLFSPQLLIGATLLGPAIYQLAQKVMAAHSLVASSTDFSGGAEQQALGRQVLTPAQIAAQLSQQHTKALTPSSDLFGDTQLKNAQSGDFSTQYKAQLSQLDGVLKSGYNDAAKSQLAREFFQQQVNGMVNQNGGAPIDPAQQEQLAEMAIAAYGGDTKKASQLLGGSTLTRLNLGGTSGTGFYSDFTSLINSGSPGSHQYANVPGIQGGAGGATQRRDVLKLIGSTALTDYQYHGDPSGLLYSALQSQLNDNGYGNQHPGKSPTNRYGANQPFYNYGSQNTQDIIRSFIDNYNQQNPKANIGLTKGQESSVQALYSALSTQADAGNQGAKTLLDSMKRAGLEFDKSGAVTAASFDKLAAAANKAAGALTPTGKNQNDATIGLPINQAYQKVTGNKNANILDLLNTPDAANYTHDITQTLQQLSGASSQGVFDPKNAEALRAEAEAIGRLKQEVAQGSQQWQQLDQLQQGVFSQLAQVPLMSGQGFTGQLQSQVSTLTDYINGQFTNSTAADFNTQVQTTTQMAQQAVGQLQQYYMQVKNAHIQMERGAEDHTIQMVRSQRDFNRQMGEAQYQFTIQQREAAYQYQLGQTEQLYQFNEQIRQMKYSIANAMGPAGAQMQAQYTMGASSALTGFNAQTQALKRSNSAVNSLSKMGLSSDVIRVFKLDDPTNFAQAERYLNDFVSNPQLIQSFNDMVAKNLNISQAIATDPNNAQFADLQRQFDHTAKVAADSFTHSAQVATEAFTHSMTQAKQSYDIQMADFQADYNRQTARSLQDLARLGEETQMTWEQLVQWAQQSGIPAIEQLGGAAQSAIAAIAAASNAVMNSLQQLPQVFNTTIGQISSSLQSFLNANPALGRAFEQANGIATQSNTSLGGVQGIVNAVASQHGWGSGNEWAALSQIIQHESGWNPNAQNPNSTAYGLFQFLNSTWAGTGYSKTSDPMTQASAGMKYIANRYGDPINAWNFWQGNHWYKAGGVFDKPQVIGIGEAGPEAVLPLDSRGAAFMAQTLRASVQMMGPNLLTEVRRGRTAPFSERMASNMSYHHTDASTHYHGGITVQAQDPNEMARKLAAKQRLSRLGRPAGSR